MPVARANLLQTLDFWSEVRALAGVDSEASIPRSGRLGGALVVSTRA
jgi:hypothetical protein